MGHKPLSKSGGSSSAHQVPKGPIRLRPLVTAMREGGDTTVELVLWVTYQLDWVWGQDEELG